MMLSYHLGIHGNSPPRSLDALPARPANRGGLAKRSQSNAMTQIAMVSRFRSIYF